MAFPQGTKLYCNADSPITTIDGGEIKNNIPFEQEGRNSQDYYGETSGRTAPVDIRWQPSDPMGMTTGRTAIKDGTLYYEFSMPSTYRTAPGWGSAGGGYYQPINRSAWVSSQFCTDSKANALEKFNKRTDKASLAQVKNEQIPPELGGSAGSGSGTNNTDKKTSTGLIVGLSALGLAVIGGMIYLFTRKK